MTPGERRRACCGKRWKSSRLRALLVFVAGVILVVAVAGSVGKAADFSRLLDALHAAEWGWLALGVPGVIAAYGGYIAAYRDAARVGDGPELPYRVAGEVVAVGFGAFVVGSAAGALALNYWALHRAGASRREAVRRVLGLNTMQWLALGVVAAVGGGAALAGLGRAPAAMSLAWLVAVPLCIAAAVYLTSPGLAPRLTAEPERPSRRGGIRGLAGWTRFVLRETLADALGGVLYVRRLLASPRRYPSGVLGYPVYWGGHLLCLYGGLGAFGVHIGLASLVLAFATGYVATSVPLPAGGTGGIEAAMTYALHAVGVPLAPALLGVLAYRLFAFWLPIVPAVALLPALRHLGQKLDKLPRTVQPGEAPAPA
jgi:putative heme transporter